MEYLSHKFVRNSNPENTPSLRGTIHTIGKFGLPREGNDFVLTLKQTACLAQDACGIPIAQAFALPQLQVAVCTPGGGC